MKKKFGIFCLLAICVVTLLTGGCISDQENGTQGVYGPQLASGVAAAWAENTIELSTRNFVPAWLDANTTEMDSTYSYNIVELDLDETALVLIDLWAYSNDTRLDHHVRNKMVPLLGLARDQNITIIHAPHDFTVTEYCLPLPGEIVTGKENGLDSTDGFDSYLKAHNITTLLYAGYRSNWCVLYRPTGIIKMSELGYNVILIRDCTIAFETPETLEGEWANAVSINMVESQFGSTTTLDALETAFLERNLSNAAR
jgi:nicotinamidase-related amidase